MRSPRPASTVRLLAILGAGLFAAGPALAQGDAGASGAGAPMPALIEAASTLGAGQFAWGRAPARAGAVSVVVSIPLQQMFVYRGAALVAVSAVSTGKRGHETPTGSFTVLQKDVFHHSNKYDDAPMPYMQRLTWDGVAIHGGRDPGYPASHGCVRVPLAFARQLYAITQLGARVLVTDDATAPGLPVDYAHVPTPPTPPDPETSATRAANLAAGATPDPALAPAPEAMPTPAPTPAPTNLLPGGTPPQ